MKQKRQLLKFVKSIKNVTYLVKNDKIGYFITHSKNILYIDVVIFIISNNQINSKLNG